MFHDHGTRYLGKMYNDDWMREKGFPREERHDRARSGGGAAVRANCARSRRTSRWSTRCALMSEQDFSQISITRDKRLVGSLNEMHLYEELVSNPKVKSQPVESIMQPAFPFVDVSTPVDLLQTMITPQNPAVLVRDFKTDKTFIITRSDLIRVM